MKPLVESMLSQLKISAKVRLPGRVGAVSNFKKEGDTAIRIALDGKAFMKVLDDLVMNDEWMLKNLKENGGLQNAAPSDEAIHEKVFGERGPIRATTTGALKSLFDYEAEAAPARAAWAGEAAKLGGGPAGPPAKGGDFKSLKVAGVHYVYEQDSERGLGHQQAGLTVSLVGELPGTVLSAKSGQLKTAVTDAGESLLPDGDFQRTINFPQLSKDKSAVSFDVTLRLPPATAKSLKEISGVLTYLVGGKTKDV